MIKLFFILSTFFYIFSIFGSEKKLNIEEVNNNSSIEILNFYDQNFKKFIDKESSINKIYEKFDPSLVNKEDIVQIENSNLFRVNVSGTYFYTSPDLDFILSDKAIKLFPEQQSFQRYNMLEEEREYNRKLLPLINKNDLIHFESTINTKGSVFIFVDYTCPYCKKFHEVNLKKINDLGFDVFYVPFLRNPQNEKVRNNLYSIFCHKDNNYKKELLNKAFNLEIIFNNSDNDNKCSYSKDYFNMIASIGEHLNIQGTPTSLFYNGNLISGYIPMNQYIHVLKGNN